MADLLLQLYENGIFELRKIKKIEIINKNIFKGKSNHEIG